MKNAKPRKQTLTLSSSSTVTEKDMQAMMNYLRNFELKYRVERLEIRKR